MGTYANKNKSTQVDKSEVLEETFNTTDGMSNGAKFWAGMGKAFVDTGRGIADLVYDAIQGEQWGEESLNNSIKESRRLDAPLMDTKAGMAGNITGNVAAFAPTAFIPGVNTYTGSALVAGGMGALQPTTEEDSRVKNIAASAPMGILGKWGGDKIVKSANNGIINAGISKAQNVVKDATTKIARKSGYKIPPSQANPSILNNALEGLSGKIQTGQHASVKNQQVTDRLARQSLGLKENTPLTTETLKSIRSEAGKSYEAVKKIGSIVTDNRYIDDLASITQDYSKLSKEFPTLAVKQIDDLVDDVTKESFDSSNLVALIKKLRFDASKNMRSMDDPVKAELGGIQRNISNKIEDLIERNIKDPSILKSFKDSRIKIAKTYAVEDALNSATGHVEAGLLGKALSKGDILTGELEVIGKTALTFPKAAQNIDKVGSVLTSSPLDWAAAATAAAASGNPAMLGMVAARPLARSTLLSKPYQAIMSTPNYNALPQKITKGIFESQAGKQVMRTAPTAGGLLSF